LITVEEVMGELQSKAKAENIDGMARFAIVGDQRMGVSVPDMRKIAKSVGKNHQLALDLWDTGVPEGMIVAGMIAEPDKLTGSKWKTGWWTSTPGTFATRCA
jgi:3-methyladenine DNA glycosylase AlkD